MFRKTAYLALIMTFIGTAAHAQKVITGPSEEDMYCSNVFSTQEPKHDLYIISGEQPEKFVAYYQGNTVFINHGANEGVKIGDEFLVSRVDSDALKQEWFKNQYALMGAMGRLYEDIGKIRVVSVEAKTSVAIVETSCDIMQRGDFVVPFSERTPPVFKPGGKFDEYAPPSGKAKAMVVSLKGWTQSGGLGDTIYLNLGDKQGVKVGDYFRIFEYEGQNSEYAYREKDTQYKLYGFGATPVPYGSMDLPRSVLGEGIVVRVGPNSATVLVTDSQREIFAGDYAELE
jgi:hypothetical protein